MSLVCVVCMIVVVYLIVVVVVLCVVCMNEKLGSCVSLRSHIARKNSEM